MAIKNTQKTLETRTERLKLKNQKFKCIEPTALEEINGLFEINPDHYYQDFDSLYGQNTTEKDIPSKKNHHECKELAPSGILVAARVHDFVFCISCSKLHYLFSQYVLDDSDYEALQTAMETFAYTCGSPIVPENHFLYDKVFVRMNLTCNLPIEQVYYSCKIKHSQICYYCGEEDNLVEPSQEILSQFQTVYSFTGQKPGKRGIVAFIFIKFIRTLQFTKK
ncbi:unnamed protein product [Rhizophagus irregularis]|uniref:Uncharacterized protein n=1 Tax=Rhizophagus irregularis TaxID=588596 RepID=A0A916EK46_9GLOM|nr:unnamed protein product [Rhizophagus irregularis]